MKIQFKKRLTKSLLGRLGIINFDDGETGYYYPNGDYVPVATLLETTWEAEENLDGTQYIVKSIVDGMGNPATMMKSWFKKPKVAKKKKYTKFMEKLSSLPKEAR